MDPSGGVYLEVLFKLFVALLFGVMIGIERSMARKYAGMRTFSLVSMGAALYVIVSQIVASQFSAVVNFDPLRVASQIIVGIGFLGAGLIIYKGPGVIGLTTAAGMWVAAGIGMAVGFGLYALAATATFFTLFIFVFLWFIEARIKTYSERKMSKEINHKEKKNGHKTGKN
jgi:putative Mg2+ transporter-C (MgtC) family protein